MSFDQWSKVNLVDCLDKLIDYRGKTPAKSEKGILTLSAKSVKNSNIDYSEAYTISEDEYKKFMVRGIPVKGDILITTEAPMGQVAKLDRNGVAVAQRLLTLRPNPKILDNDYLLYYLQSPIGQAELKARESGSTVTGIKQAEFRKINIILPPLSEQKVIANILSSLDDKIELNNKINKNLEELAQTLYKRWFVDFEFPNEDGEPYKSIGGEMVESELGLIPKGWRVGRLDECIDFNNGYAFRADTLLNNDVDNSYNVFKMGHIKKGGGFNSNATKNWIEKSKCTNLEKYVLKIGDLLMCMTDMKANVALLGHTALMNTDGKYIVNQRVGLLRVNNNYCINYPYLYLVTNSNDFISNLRGRANSGVQVNLSTNEIKSSKIMIAPNIINYRFNEIVITMYDQIMKNEKENKALLQTRDELLPKLMNGEIEIPIEE